MSFRRIVHIDMDAFFASVEQRDFPDLRNKPIAVGRAETRGVVAAASYEARRFGVRSAMPSITAKRLCPELIFVPPRFDVYRAISAHIHSIFTRYTPVVQPLALDEAALDLTDHLAPFGSATRIAEHIRAAINAETGLTASAGISYNRFLAKLASDQRKPNGIFVIRPKDGPHFVAALPIDRFHGIGPSTAKRMNALGITNGAELRKAELHTLMQNFGKTALFYHNIARGIDERPVNPNRIRKSLGTEQTYLEDLINLESCTEALEFLARKLWLQAESRNIQARTLTLKIKYANFQQITRARTLSEPFSSAEMCLDAALSQLNPLFPLKTGIRLLGLTLSGFADSSSPQLNLNFS
ncbi:DNA polymerase IV [Neokomagataea tanensis]|uniref:DNA polymerase IV n=2 Tax=Neokomagataea TaxID=1223423 RepID=A0A4Y6V764_9PROT|nr:MULTISPECIES: DNA polymerase IV [Neokomagataea]QDH24510.1 DNA polymerase IV [Neokomagataea tanensis]